MRKDYSQIKASSAQWSRDWRYLGGERGEGGRLLTGAASGADFDAALSGPAAEAGGGGERTSPASAPESAPTSPDSSSPDSFSEGSGVGSGVDSLRGSGDVEGRLRLGLLLRCLRAEWWKCLRRGSCRAIVWLLSSGRADNTSALTSSCTPRRVGSDPCWIMKIGNILRQLPACLCRFDR